MSGNVDAQAKNKDTKEWMKAHPEQKHFIDVEEEIPVNMDPYFMNLGLRIIDIEKQKQSLGSKVSGEEAAKKVFLRWLQSMGRAATLQALIDGFDKCKFHKAQAILEDAWKQDGKKNTDQLEEKHIYPIIRELTPNQLTKLFSKGLGISEKDIEIYKDAGDDTYQKVMRLLNFWQQRKPEGTLEDLLKAFENVSQDAIETLTKKW